MSRAKEIRVAVLLSGSGRTLANIIKLNVAGKLSARVVTVISSRSTVKGVQIARDADLPCKVIRTKDHPDVDEFSSAIADVLDAAKVDLVVQAGWLCYWKIPDRYIGRVMNIHPALLPSFGGKGMWGHHVHEAVLADSRKVSGCTVHFVNNEYDEGPIILQRTCEVSEADDADSLAARVFEQETVAYPAAIQLFAQNRLQITNNRVRVLCE